MRRLLLLGILFQIQILVFAKPEAKIQNGTIEGMFLTSRNGRTFSAFRGIPYALPPVNELRFEPPKPAESWKGKFSAKSDPNICVQRNIYTHQEEIVGDEDCLYLNVYTPKVADTKCSDRCQNNYPVMIWFHGGGWVTGAGNYDFYGPKFLLDHDVVLVTVNYRLGPLGFMSTEDMVLPGNLGMKDQAQAIRWVHENIESFSGDPNRVTLFGESAGGVAVHYHMISPLSRGLFHRGISQSGTALCPWALTKTGQAKQKAFRVGELLKCSTKNSKELVQCLRKKDARDIIGTDRDFQVFDYCPMIPFRPVIEPDHPGAFLKEHPIESLKNGRLMDIPWMSGVTSHEGALRVAGLYGIDGQIDRLNKEFKKLLPITLLFDDTCPQHLKDDVTEKVQKFYLKNRPVDNSTKFDVLDMYSDSWFTYAGEQAARIHLDRMSAPTYFYYLAYKAAISFSQIFGDKTGDYGVSHADDLQYLFPVREQLFPDAALTDSDQKIIDFITSTWVQFAKTGNPTPEITKSVPVKWTPLHTDKFEYLYIDGPNDIFMAKHLLPERMDFWRKIPHKNFPETIPKVRDEL